MNVLRGGEMQWHTGMEGWRNRKRSHDEGQRRQEREGGKMRKKKKSRRQQHIRICSLKTSVGRPWR